MPLSFVRMAIVLGLLSAISPFAIDMYMPAMPAIAADLGASDKATQMTLVAFFVSFGVCQLLYGPVSDVIGRKVPLYFGLVVFLVGSIGCAFATDIAMLVVCRIVQGVGASAVTVIPRAIIRDLHTGAEAARLMSLVMLVFSVSPILAPLIGSALIIPFGWRAVFVAVAVASLVSLAISIFILPETRPAGVRTRSGMREMLSNFGRLLRDVRFMGLTFVGGFGISSFFSFLASSPFVYMNHFGLTPVEYSMAFAVNAVSFIGASQLSGRLGARFGLSRVVLAAVTGYAACACILLIATMATDVILPVLVMLLLGAYGFLGLVVPSTMVLALDDYGSIAGMASALAGTMQMVLGALMIAVVSAFSDGTPIPMVSAITGCALTSMLLAYVTLKRSA